MAINMKKLLTIALTIAMCSCHTTGLFVTPVKFYVKNGHMTRLISGDTVPLKDTTFCGYQITRK